VRDYDFFVERLDLRGENPVRREAMRRLREAGEVAKPALFLGLGHPPGVSVTVACGSWTTPSSTTTPAAGS
jgi:hypothetical protein